MTAIPFAARSLTTRKRLATSSESRTADGSSMMISLASWESARAIETTCLPAAESCSTSVVGEMLEWPSRLSISRVRAWTAERWVKPATLTSLPRKMFSATVRPSTTSSSWYMVAIPARSAAIGVAKDTSCPCQVITPASGLCAPASTLISVDLPAPFWPRRQCTSPG